MAAIGMTASFAPNGADFFASAGLSGRLPKVVRCGDRARAFRRFSDAVRKAGGDEIIILLVDSEGPVKEGQSTWEYLRDNDGWRQPAGADDNRAHLMVQAMEAWLMADRNALREYFGPRFQREPVAGAKRPGANSPK